jgi:hypothetical protein
MVTLEHIDPRNGVLVCGLCNEFNEIFANFLYNSRKNNRFVPYRVCDFPAPVTFGDVGEFLIDEEWTVCEFGGPEWWEESNKIGNANTKGGSRHTEAQVKARSENGKKSPGNPHTFVPYLSENGKKNVQVMIKHPNSIKNRFSSDDPKTKTFGIKVGNEKWKSLIDGFISNAAGVARHNRNRGWDPEARIRV